MSEWKPIETLVPQEGDVVDLWTENGRIPDAEFEDGRWTIEDNSQGGWASLPILSKITHWMPTPAPPA